MMRERDNETSDDVDNGVLERTDNLETTGIGIVDGTTAQIDLALPRLSDDDDDYVEDEDSAVPVNDHDLRYGDQDADGEEGLGEDLAAEDLATVEPAEEVVDAEVVVPAAEAAVATHTGVTRRAMHHPVSSDKHALERVRGARVEEEPLQSRRLDQLSADRESPDLLTADRLIDRARVAAPEPEGVWQRLVYGATRGRVALADNPRVRARKELDRRISAPLAGGAKFVPVLSRKGGVGKTSVTTLLGWPSPMPGKTA